MARFDRGWFMLDREDISAFEGDGHLIALWCLLNSWAHLQESEIKKGNTLHRIPAGALFTTSLELEKKLKCDRSVVRRCLKFLELSGYQHTITFKQGMIIFLKSNQYLNQRIKQAEDKQDIEDEDFNKSKKPTLETSTNHQRTINTPSTHTCIEEVIINKKEEGGGERARELAGIPPPPILKSLNQKEIGNGHTQPEAGLLVSVEVNELGASWLWWALESAPSGKFELSEFNTAIIRIQEIRKCNTAEIRQLFEFIKTDSKLSGIFISPCWHDKKWGGGITLLDDAWIKAFPKRKEDSKKEISAEEMVERIRLKRLKASHGG